MLNKRPIFLFCFSRGGSNIFWNLFLSHPETASPIRETLEIFRMGIRAPRPEGFLFTLLSQQPRFFDQRYLEPRRPLNSMARDYLDKTLYEWKLKTFSDSEMRQKSENSVYSLEEVQNARLVTKNNNALVFLSDEFARMYPDAVFFGLIRHPLALYESYRRHRFVNSLDAFGRFYNCILERMMQDAERFPNYHLLRFEDILEKPLDVLATIYQQANLDLGKVEKLRFKAKGHLNEKGEYGSKLEIGSHYWFDLQALDAYFESNINEFQIRQLKPEESKRIMDMTGANMEKLGYAPRGDFV